jgi:hypothetical protein
MMRIDEGSGTPICVEHRIVEYGVRYSGCTGEPKTMEQEDLESATQAAAKLDGYVMQRITFVTEWEPHFDTPSDVGEYA